MIATDDGICAVTVSSAVPVIALPPLRVCVAVIVAVPAATGVARPDPSTVATEVAEDDHVIAAPLTPLPFASCTSAENCCV